MMNGWMIFPNALLPLKENGGKCFGAFLENNEVAAAALAAPSPVQADEMCLLNLCVKRSLREQGIAHAFLQKLSAVFAEEGKSSLRVRCMGSLNQMREVYELLISNGFAPCLLTGRVMSWQMSDWLESPLAQQMKKTTIPTDHICLAQALSEKVRASLKARVGDYDEKLSCFYVVEGKLAGAVFVKKIDDDTVWIYRIQIAENVPFKKVVVPLFVSLLHQLRRVFSESAAVIVCSDGFQTENVLRKLFDDPDSESFVQEYKSLLNGNEEGSKKQLETGYGLRFGIMPEEIDEDNENFSDALYSQDTFEMEVCLQQKEFLYPCKKVKNELALREEMNAWLKLLRRDPLPPQKPLPFRAYLEQIQKESSRMEDELNTETDLSEENLQPVEAKDLKYFVFPEDSEIFARVLPDFLNRGNQKHIVIGAKSEEDELYGYASFRKQPTPQKTMMLEYLFVTKARRNCGIASQMLRFAREVFSSGGINGITTKQAGKGEQLKAMHLFLRKSGFLPLTLSARTIVYYLEDVCESMFMQMPKNKRAQFPNIEEIEDRDDYRIIDFTRESKKEGFYFDRYNYDTAFTKFYIEDNQIHAVLSMDQVSENLLMMQDTYMARTCNSPYVQPALLLSVLEKAKMCMRDDAMMVLQLYEGWKMEALEALLGPGEESLQLCEYVMPFR